MDNNLELDKKILILYILSRLPGPVDQSSLFNIVNENNIGYFDFAQWISELEERGNVETCEDGIMITEVGLRNSDAVKSEIPYTVKKKTDGMIPKLSDEIKRRSLVKAEINSTDCGPAVHLSMSDGECTLIDLSLAVADEKQAESIKKKFKKSPEKIYKEIVEYLTK